MLMFATEFPVKAEGGAAQFAACFKKWILGSPHTVLKEEDFDLNEVDSEGWVLEKGTQKLRMLHAQIDKNASVAFRNQIEDAGLEWNTEVVFSRDELDSWVGVRTFCDALQPARALPAAKKPLIVSALLRGLQGANDGELDVSGTARYLSDDEVGLASRLIRGEAGCQLPVVYLSAAFGGERILDPSALSSDLAGMAHVVVEPNRAFSVRLKIEASSENVYGGAAGVYWPDGSGRRSYFLPRDFQRRGEMKTALLNEIRSALIFKRPSERCMWASVQEAAARSAIIALKHSDSGELSKYIENFDSEIKASQKKLASAEIEIARLKAEIRMFEARAPVGGALTLATGEEQSFYPNEIAALICEILYANRETTILDSRRRHIVDAIINNNLGMSVIETRRRTIRELLNGYTSLTPKIRRGLEDVGFSISEEGKHYKLLFQGDGRYIFSLAKSGSDHRGGANMASDICKTIL